MRARTRLIIESHGSSCERLETLFVMSHGFIVHRILTALKFETTPNV